MATTGHERLRMPPGASASADLAPALASALRDVLLHAAAQVSRADENATKAVHVFRKSVRRARALLALVQPLSKDAAWARELRSTLRDVHQSTSSWRDADVLVAALAHMPTDDTLAPLWQAVERALQADALATRAPDGPAALLAEGAARFAQAPAIFERKLRGATPASIATCLERTYARARDRRARAARTARPEHVHAFRKRTKELAYQLELFAPEARAQALREHAVRLAKRLGEITDLHVLETRIADLTTLDRKTRRAARAIVVAEQQRRQLAAIAASDAFFAPLPAAWTAAFAPTTITAAAVPRPRPKRR